MKLSELLKDVPPHLAERSVSFLETDSRKTEKHCLFFAIEGTKNDGHDFVPVVLNNDGATAAIVQKDHPRTHQLLKDNRVIAVEDVRQTLGEVAARFYNNPSLKMVTCGVTGTNGKTTTTYLLEALLKEWGKKPAIVGTIENRLGDLIIPSTHTTPDAIALQKLLHDFASRGADALAIEVTSHALEQHRVWGMHFDVAIFTNLTQDHLDYHHSLENYFKAKQKLFTDYEPTTAIINADDEYGKKLIDLCGAKGQRFFTFGKQNCGINYGKLEVSAQGIKGDIELKLTDQVQKIAINSNLVGNFNAANIAGVVAAGIALNMPFHVISTALSKPIRVPGRMETVPNFKGVNVVVDYAHTPDALEKALTTLKKITHGRLLCVFGCGGDRDPSKRPLMGTVAAKYADELYVTSDNPRTENPESIIEDVLGGIPSGTLFYKITDRKDAIASAIQALKPQDTLLIAGKGHENYQIIGSQKLPFDDRIIAQENLK